MNEPQNNNKVVQSHQEDLKTAATRYVYLENHIYANVDALMLQNELIIPQGNPFQLRKSRYDSCPSLFYVLPPSFSKNE